MFRRIVPIAACVLAVFGALAIRVVVEGRAAVRAGDEAAAKGAPIAAIDHYETAARWYFPVAPHVDDAYGKLRALAASNDPATSLAAWRAIRSAARATRSLWTPHADDLAAADAAIARLAAHDLAAGQLGDEAGPPPEHPRGSGSDAITGSGAGAGSAATPVDAADHEAWHRQRLAVDVRPSVGAGALAGFGILLWLGGVWALVRRGIAPTGGWLRRPATASVVAIVVGLGLWFVGLYNA
jgi:hypothetical protein